MSRSPRFLTAFEQGDIPLEGPILVIRPTEFAGLAELGAPVLEQGFAPQHHRFEAGGFSVAPTVEGRFATVLVQLTRAKAENLGNIARACQMSDGMVVVDGAKNLGIESLLKAVKKITEVNVISKSHGKVFWFEATPMPQEWLLGAQMAKNKDGFFTAPGMFSYEKIDAGSAFLAPHLAGLSGRVADLGAGWGWLAAQALGADVSEITLFEGEHMALEAAKRNITDERARFNWADVLGLPKTEPFDAIISNPPFHQGRAAMPELGVGFIQAAAKMLKPKGRFLMVANRHLPYEAALEARFRKWEMKDQNGGFKVFEASLPKR